MGDMRVLVTGATGFVGSHLAERLCHEGAAVACLVRPTSRLTALEGLPVETRVGTLEDADSLARAAADAQIVFHVAGITRARTPEAYLRANAEATARLVDAVARSCPGLRRFVYVSSLAAVGPAPTPEPLDETADPRPLPGYGASKLAGEHAVLAARDRLPVTIVRPPAVYGPRDPNFIALFRTARRLRLAPVIGGRDKMLSMVHAADLADGLWRAATTDAAVGQTYFIASGTHTWGDIVAALAAALGRRVRVLPIPSLVARLIGEIGELRWTLTGKPQIICRRKIRDLLAPRWICTWAKAEHQLGYRPAMRLEEGFRQTAEWYAREGWLQPAPTPFEGTR